MKGLNAVDLERLYREHVDAVYGYLSFKLRDSQAVEDLVQETFLAAHQGLNRLHSVNSPKAWLLTIAHNKLVDFLRRRPVHLPLQAESLAAAGGEAANLFAQEILEQLAEPERTIVYGLYVEGLTYRELGEMLGIPKGTVKSKAHYARKYLYNWLQGGSR
jgi:RNA polymerase sigma factor (sigma-70 family)